jgi:WXG100 family type VII secretion target
VPATERIATMSESDILIQYENMSQAAASLKSQAGLIQNLVDDLGNSLQPLYQTWGMTGSKAADAMQQDENNLKATISDIIELLNQFSGAVNQAVQLQQGIDSSNARMFGSYA